MTGKKKKNVPHPKDTIGKPPEVNESIPSSDMTTGKTLGEREAWIVVREKAVLNREDGAGLREEGASLREEGASFREEGASLREEAADLREEAADLREETADLREETANQREEAADLDEKALHEGRNTDKVKAARKAITEGMMREANEQLIVASIHAQTMAETAEQATRQMTHLAEHDFLTGLPIRRLLTDRLAQAITLAQRHGKKVALIYLDLDHFKHINDSLGHEVGDKLLKSVAKRMQAHVRLSDTVSRHGGDEFVVLLPEVDNVQGAVLTAEKLIEAMAEPHLIGNHRLHITLSIGISLYPDVGKDAEEVIRNADIAMYYAKKSGRNRYKVFTPDMNTRSVWRNAIEQGLHQALDQDKFVLHYQPKVNLATGAITGAEALLRWQLSAHRLVIPRQFLSIAEDCGLILQIGKWVLREACLQAQAWSQASREFGHISVNISVKEFLSNDFLSSVRTILDDTGLAPHHLEIEVTESGLMHDTQQTTATLFALKDLGVKIAIDDFGTGYSCLSNLSTFPIDTLKIDQSFVQDIDGDTGNAIVSAIIAMGMNLKQRVVAEGIETQQQLAFLKSQHCTEGQGYYFGRPMVAEEFAQLLSVDSS
jgi:diguanylate cyclase (GGDEF)-like protein